jgi:hypothetical protein
VGTLVSAFEPRDLKAFKTETALIAEYRTKLIPSLKQSGHGLEVQHTQLVANLEKYRLSLPEAAKRFRELAALYDGYSETEPDPFFIEEYKDMARRAEVFAKAMEARLAAVEQWQQEAAAKQQFVQRSLVYLDRLDEFLSIVPSRDKTMEIQEYVERLNKYIEQVQKGIEGVREYARKLEVSLNGEGESSGKQDTDSQKAKRSPQTDSLRSPGRGTKSSQGSSTREPLKKLENRLRNLKYRGEKKVASRASTSVEGPSRKQAAVQQRPSQTRHKQNLSLREKRWRESGLFASLSKDNSKLVRVELFGPKYHRLQ